MVVAYKKPHMHLKFLHRTNKMKKLFLSFFILMAAATVVHSQLSFHKLALQWPASFCTGVRRTCLDSAGSIDYFTIHGLWPHDRNGYSVPAYDPVTNRCVGLPVPPDSSQLNAQLDQDLKDDLLSYWPNLYHHLNYQEDLSFWQYEWDQHGRCSGYAHYPLEYFDIAVDRLLDYDIVQMLQHQRIRTGTIQKAGAIRAALQRELGVYPELHCNRNSTGYFQPLEVRICLDRNVVNLRPCPQYFTGGCRYNDDVYFPASLPPPPPPP